MKNYIVVSCEHTNKFNSMPNVEGVFDSKELAQDYIDEAINIACNYSIVNDIGNNTIQLFDEGGNPDWGKCWKIFPLDIKADVLGKINTHFDKIKKLSKIKCNKYGVPYHKYELTLISGQTLTIDVGCEEDWGNIQDCNIYDVENGDCKSWVDSVGWGNDNDGHKQIVKVVDLENGQEWNTHNSIHKWANDRVWCYVDNYCGEFCN